MYSLSQILIYYLYWKSLISLSLVRVRKEKHSNSLKKKKKTLIITLIISIQHISVSVQAWWQFYSSESRFTAPAEWFTVLDQRYCHNKFFWQKSTQTKWHKTTSDFGNVHFIFSSCFFFSYFLVSWMAADLYFFFLTFWPTQAPVQRRDVKTLKH